MAAFEWKADVIGAGFRGTWSECQLLPIADLQNRTNSRISVAVNGQKRPSLVGENDEQNEEHNKAAHGRE
jgi:hypothetical protein